PSSAARLVAYPNSWQSRVASRSVKQVLGVDTTGAYSSTTHRLLLCTVQNISEHVLPRDSSQHMCGGRWEYVSEINPAFFCCCTCHCCSSCCLSCHCVSYLLC
ncbi:unnamed protein product, partial [Ectocarpus sp. 12 AP-2014]